MTDSEDVVIEGPKLVVEGKVAEDDPARTTPGGSSTTLHSAAGAGDKDRVQELLLAGADVNALDDDGKTALHVAAKRGGGDDGGDVVRALLRAGADVTLRHGRDDFSALDEATGVGCLGALEAMIAHGGVDLNAACCDGWTALHVSSTMSANPCAIDRLVEAGADIEARDVHGYTPLHAAVAHEKPEVVRHILARGGADMDALKDRGCSALHLAAAASDCSSAVDMVQALLDAGACAFYRDEDGTSAADFAAAQGNAGALSALIEHDVDVAAPAPRPPGLTPLHYAGASRDPRVVEVLVEAGADVTATEDNGVSCIHYAAALSNAAVAEAMLVNAGGGAKGLRRMDLQMALFLAATCAGKHEKPAAAVVDLLLRWGAHESVLLSAGSRWLLIGKSAPRDIPARRKDVRRVRQLLRNAPKDRAWRRRGFLVVCRAFPDRAQVKEHESDLPRSDTPPRSCARRPRLVATGDAGAGDWVGVVDRLLWLDDGVFRAIIEYL